MRASSVQCHQRVDFVRHRSAELNQQLTDGRIGPSLRRDLVGDQEQRHRQPVAHRLVAGEGLRLGLVTARRGLDRPGEQLGIAQRVGQPWALSGSFQ